MLPEQQLKAVTRRRLTPTQRNAFHYCLRRQHPALFMPMRTGKTLVAIRRVNLYKSLDPEKLHILVVAPSSALLAWIDELTAEGEADFRLLVGKRQDRILRLRENAKWYLANKEVHLVVPEIASIPWDAIILDESPFIKNPRTKTSGFYTNFFRTVPHRWILTGTPNSENNLELYQQMKFLDGHFLHINNYWKFRSRFFIPGFEAYRWEPAGGTMRMITQTLARRVFVCKKPARLGSRRVIKRLLSLPPKIKKTYKDLEENFALGDLETKWIVVKYNWLHRLSGGVLGGKVEWDGKLEDLISLLKYEVTEPCVVWFHYNDEMDVVAQMLAKNGIRFRLINGDVLLQDREFRINEWKKGFCNVLLAQQAVANYGLDLSKANVAIFYSLAPSSALHRQVVERIDRIGKRNDLLYIYLLTEGTVDMDLYNLLEEKRFYADATMYQILREKLRDRVRQKKEWEQQ
jgi:SNF2 family DNA or RNA helicase